MHKLFVIFFSLFVFNSINAQLEKQFCKQFVPIQFEENISLKGFDIEQTYKIGEEQFILIGFNSTNNTGKKILHLQQKDNRYHIQYESRGAYDSYSYEPYFYKISQDSTLILCNMGTEYDWGTDAYLLTQDSLKSLGFLNVSVQDDKDNPPGPIVYFLEIFKEDGKIYFDVVKNESDDFKVYLFMDTEKEQIYTQPIRLCFSDAQTLNAIKK